MFKKSYQNCIDKMKYFPLDSFVNFNLKVPGYIFKDEYEGN